MNTTYIQVLRNLRKAIRRKRPKFWRSHSWILHQDNVPTHTALLIQQFLAKYNTVVMPRLFLFPKLKRILKGERFSTIDEIKAKSNTELKRIHKEVFPPMFLKLETMLA
ncbi:uncharacterized protein LOC108908355 [Anoplophora glabripennis]|uniref:uncharacterized protein LOC108908355 n=1 Tax=Anoplophora glabripennis TaxID=217634 RepID=UPI0008736836|nr:uncharacterized protein LOC108908355 [Anoplophora glabripennis]